MRCTVLVVCVLLAACDTDEINSLKPLDRLELASSAASQPLHNVVRGLAYSLKDVEVRRIVKEAMVNSPFDGAVSFDGLLAVGTPTIGSRLSELATQEGWSLSSAMDKVGNLQLHMPVPEHRATWRGGAELIVAGLLSEEEEPVGFDLQGVPFVLGETPPERPVLAITRAEVDFTESASVAATSNLTSHDSPGLYMASYQVWDDWEHWLLGSPEFEIHTFVVVDDSTLQWVGCAGEAVYSNRDHYHFDGGTSWSGRVQLHRYDVVADDTTIVQMWERDSDTGCKGGERGSQAYDPERDAPKTEDSIWSWQVMAFFTATGCPQVGTPSDPEDAYYCLGILGTATWLQANLASDPDDFVGQIDMASVCWREASGPVPARFWGVVGQDIYGRTGVVEIDAYGTDREPICPPHVRVSGPLEICVDRHGFPAPDPSYYATDVWGGVGTISLSWEEDGMPSGSGSYYQMQNTTPGERDIRVRMYRGSETASDAVRVAVYSWDDAQCEGGGGSNF